MRYNVVFFLFFSITGCEGRPYEEQPNIEVAISSEVRVEKNSDTAIRENIAKSRPAFCSSTKSSGLSNNDYPQKAREICTDEEFAMKICTDVTNRLGIAQALNKAYGNVSARDVCLADCDGNGIPTYREMCPSIVTTYSSPELLNP